MKKQKYYSQLVLFAVITIVIISIVISINISGVISFAAIQDAIFINTRYKKE